MDTRRVSIAVQRGERCDQFELEAGELRVGSASHCDVRLGPDEAAPEQFSISADPRGVCLRALSAAPLALLHGTPLTRAVVESSAVLELGALTLTVQLVSTRARPDRQGELLKNARLTAMLIGTLLLGYSLLNEAPVQSAFQRPVAPPALFAQLAPNCRESDRDGARVLAREQLSAAEAKRERSPFRLFDGVQAVPLYATAAACFEQAGDPSAAREAAGAAQQLAVSLQQSLQAHAAQLEYFLGRARYAAAATELAPLRELCAGRNDAYAQWLVAVARELPSALARTNKEQQP